MHAQPLALTVGTGVEHGNSHIDLSANSETLSYIATKPFRRAHWISKLRTSGAKLALIYRRSTKRNTRNHLIKRSKYFDSDLAGAGCTGYSEVE